MSYSIIPILHNYVSKKGFSKIYIQIIYNRIPIKVTTNYKVLPEQFSDGWVTNHPNKGSINGNLRKEITEIETRLIDFLRTGKPSKKDLEKIGSNSPKLSGIRFVDFIRKYNMEMKGKLADGTIAIFESLNPDLDEYEPNLLIDKIDVSWLNTYEQWQRAKGWEINTIHKKMSKIKTMLNEAEQRGHIEKKRFEKYVVPLYIQKIPEYINEGEMDAIKEVADTVRLPHLKMAGYYFLLACYAGYRLSDLQKFDYTKFVKEEKIIIRAQKNKEIVLMPLYTRLIAVLNYIRENPLNMSEQYLRENIKEVVKLAGINRHIKIHSGRHSFAMMLMDNGFELSDVAALLGVSLKTAAIYGRISNKRLESKVRSKLG